MSLALISTDISLALATVSKIEMVNLMNSASEYGFLACVIFHDIFTYAMDRALNEASLPSNNDPLLFNDFFNSHTLMFRTSLSGEYVPSYFPWCVL